MIANTANSLFMYYLSMPYTANNIKISYIKRMTKHCHARGMTGPNAGPMTGTGPLAEITCLSRDRYYSEDNMPYKA